ncbi:hypothetical protein OMCYN_01682 [cyanobiont of Ornithocercus magnificus]|nr:hypothetical protein OMCYN_01682 [cyanobiont of Ornithocercus magnificus]
MIQFISFEVPNDAWGCLKRMSFVEQTKSLSKKLQTDELETVRRALDFYSDWIMGQFRFKDLEELSKKFGTDKEDMLKRALHIFKEIEKDDL